METRPLGVKKYFPVKLISSEVELKLLHNEVLRNQKKKPSTFTKNINWKFCADIVH